MPKISNFREPEPNMVWEPRIERTKHGDDETSNIDNDSGGLATLFLEDYKSGGVVLPLKASG